MDIHRWCSEIKLLQDANLVFLRCCESNFVSQGVTATCKQWAHGQNRLFSWKTTVQFSKSWFNSSLLPSLQDELEQTNKNLEKQKQTKRVKCQADSVKRQTLVGRSIFIRNMNFYNSIHKNSIKSKVKRVWWLTVVNLTNYLI